MKPVLFIVGTRPGMKEGGRPVRLSFMAASVAGGELAIYSIVI
jgi:hypothetical protein